MEKRGQKRVRTRLTVRFGERDLLHSGFTRDLSESDLQRAYKSMVDPRLNYEQSLELAMLIVRKNGRSG